ncbi:MAG TPA: 50S ribosomal protein L18 [Cytophagales bacterium]|nr:50S ribosomal protein L18 [Cytophagales bacterium]
MAFSREDRRTRIKRRIRKKVKGTSDRPRLSVFRSNTSIYAQLIDDTKGITLVSSSSKLQVSEIGSTKLIQSRFVGLNIAKIALEKGVKEVVFDRNGYLYHGRVKSLAEGAREGGLIF